MELHSAGEIDNKQENNPFRILTEKCSREKVRD